MTIGVLQPERREPASGLLTPREVAAILRVTPRTVARYAEAGRLERVWLSTRASRYTVVSVERLLTDVSVNESSPVGEPDSTETSDAGARHEQA